MPSQLPPSKPPAPSQTEALARNPSYPHLIKVCLYLKGFPPLPPAVMEEKILLLLGIIPLPVLRTKFSPIFVGPCLTFMRMVFKFSYFLESPRKILNFPVPATSSTNNMRTCVGKNQHQYFFSFQVVPRSRQSWDPLSSVFTLSKGISIFASLSHPTNIRSLKPMFLSRYIHIPSVPLRWKFLKYVPVLLSFPTSTLFSTQFIWTLALFHWTDFPTATHGPVATGSRHPPLPLPP